MSKIKIVKDNKTPKGKVATEQPCAECGGTGKASDGKGRCPACHGAGMMRVWR